MVTDRGGVTGVRLDRALVDRGLARSRGHARDLIEAGLVRVGDAVAARPAQPVTDDAPLRVEQDAGSPGRPVGRGHRKLAHALDSWTDAAAAVQGARCLDAGASTGGFTQVLLERGARQVMALDVGHDQLDPQLRADPRVVDRSGTNLREVDVAGLGGPFDVVVADLSFISLTLVLRVLRELCQPDGTAIVLVKPQFEVGRAALSKSGVVRDERDRVGAVLRVMDAAVESGWGIAGLLPSPVTGGAGNAEYLLRLCAPGADRADAVRSRVWTIVTGRETARAPR